MTNSTDHDDQAGEWHFSGFVLPTTTPVPDQLFDELLYRLAPAEMMVLLYIVRRTLGFKKQDDNISLKQMVEGIRTKDGRVLDRGTGLSKATVARALAGLEAKQVIVRTRRRSFKNGDEPTTYHLNFPGAPALHTDLRPPAPVSHFETPRVSRERHPRVSNRDTQQTVKQKTVKQHGGGVSESNEKTIQTAVDHEKELLRGGLAVPRSGIAQELHAFGLSPEAANQLVDAYPAEHILAKLDFVRWLGAHGRAPANPPGYLRQAIQLDYTPPPGYRPPEQRHAEAVQDATRHSQDDAAIRAAEAAYQEAKALARAQLAAATPPEPIAGSTLTTQAAWEQALAQLREQVTAPLYHTFLKDTKMVSCVGGSAVIVAPHVYVAETLTGRLRAHLDHTLSSVLGYPVVTRVVAFETLATEDPDRDGPAHVAPRGG